MLEKQQSWKLVRIYSFLSSKIRRELRVLRECAWTINGNSMVVRIWEKMLKLEQIELSYIDTWIQFHGLWRRLVRVLLNYGVKLNCREVLVLHGK